jgi:hypothetical protein
MDTFTCLRLIPSKDLCLDAFGPCHIWRAFSISLMLLVLHVPGNNLTPILSIVPLVKTTKMQCGTSPSFAHQFEQYKGASIQASFIVRPHTTSPVSLVRLRQEKEILENGLANCVMYLHVLRKKQARNERLLNLDSLPTCKKRKKIQQSKRELDREIRNRQRDEQAFLSNLRTCKANIYVAEGLSHTITNLSPMEADCTSTTTQYSFEESEPTEISWNGWTEGAVLSPFEKRRSNTFVVDEVAPDELVIGEDHDYIATEDSRRPLPLIRNAEEMAALPVPPNSARSQHSHSSLCPEAAVFDPRANSLVQIDKVGVSLDSTDSIETVETRRYTEAEVVQSLKGLSIHARLDSVLSHNYSWCNTTPQGSSRKHTCDGTVARRRSNSL